jgi:hypothetical protein
MFTTPPSDGRDSTSRSAILSYVSPNRRSPAPSTIGSTRLVLPTDTRGLPLDYTIVPASEKEYEPLADLLTGTVAEVVIGDKGV